jgi:hypothetical protein
VFERVSYGVEVVRMSQATRVLKVAFVFGLAILEVGCSGEDTRRLDPGVLAMTADIAPFYDDGETTLYQTVADVSLPIRNPSSSERQKLSTAIKPFDHTPWITPGQVKVQVSWTLANLDKESHAVEVLIDPWNEFGRYVPGITVEGDDSQPNLSGIDEQYDLPGLDSGSKSRITGVFTYDSMDELATDFATAINIIQNGPMAEEGSDDEDPRVGLVNHVFAVENRSGNDPLTDQYIPKTIPALVGFQLGVRTHDPVNIAIEYAIELIDANGDRLLDDGSKDPPLSAPATTFTVGNG